MMFDSLTRPIRAAFVRAARSKLLCLICGILLLAFMSAALIAVTPSNAQAQRRANPAQGPGTASGTNGAAAPATVLPLIAFTDRARSVSMRWWMGEGKIDDKKPERQFLISLANLLNSKLSDEFLKQNLTVVKILNQGIAPDLPQRLQIEHPSPQDLSAISSYFKVAMLARGDVRLIPSNVAGTETVTVKIQVVEASAPDHVLAEVVREFASDPHAPSVEIGVRNKSVSEFAALAKDLSAQVLAAWQRGTTSTSLMSVNVRGQLNPSQQAFFKSAFLRNVHEMRDLKERMFEHDLVVYEGEFSGDTAQLVSRVRALKMQGFDLQIANDQNPRAVTVNVTPNGT